MDSATFWNPTFVCIIEFGGNGKFCDKMHFPNVFTELVQCAAHFNCVNLTSEMFTWHSFSAQISQTLTYQPERATGSISIDNRVLENLCCFDRWMIYRYISFSSSFRIPFRNDFESYQRGVIKLFILFILPNTHTPCFVLSYSTNLYM